MDYEEDDLLKVLSGKDMGRIGKVSGLHLKDVNLSFEDGDGGSYRYHNVEKATEFVEGKKVKRYLYVDGHYEHVCGDFPVIDEIVNDEDGGIIFLKDEQVGYDLEGNTYRPQKEFGSYIEKME